MGEGHQRSRHSARIGSRNYYAGGLIALIGLGATLKAHSYDSGTLSNMGPGFFPTTLGIMLVVIGIVIALFAGREGASEELRFNREQWRAWVCILGGPLMFMLLGTRLGLAPATFACVFVSALGDRTATLRGALILSIIVTIVGSLFFWYVMQVQLPLVSWTRP